MHRVDPSETMAAVKALRISLWLIIAALIVGNAYHFARYDSIGLFEWSSHRDPESGDRAIVRTSTVSASAEAPVIMASAAPAGSDAPEPAAPAPPAPKPKAKAKPAADPNLHVLFDGKKLGKWEPIQFGGEGEVVVTEDGTLEFDFGAIMTGVKWSEEPPAKSNYEIELDAMRLDGNDFFCALTFPVKESHATFVIGGWGGGIVGISSVDDLDASENETMNVEGFEQGVWYRVKVRVTDEKIEAWIDDRQMVDLELGDKKISLRPGDIELCVPVGIASFMTRAQYRNITWRNLTPEQAREPGTAPEPVK